MRMVELAAVATLAAVSGALAFVGIPLDRPGRPRSAVEAPRAVPSPATDRVTRPAEVAAAIRAIARPAPRETTDDPFSLLLPPPRTYTYHPPDDLRLSALGTRAATEGLRRVIAQRTALLDDGGDGATDLLFYLGASYQRTGDFERAAEYYEAFARHAPSSDAASCDPAARRDGTCPDAPTALENAILFRRALGQVDRALSNVELFERWYGETRVEDAARVSAQAGALLAQDGGRDEAVSHHAALVASYARHVSPGAALRMQVELGRARWDAGDRAGAARVFRGVVARWKRDVADRVAALPDDGADPSGAEFSRTLAAVSEAAFLLAEQRYDAFRALHRPVFDAEPTPSAIDAWTAHELRPWVVRKAHALRDARDAYDRVAALGVTEHQIASRRRVGQMFRSLMDDLASVPLPRAVIVAGDEQISEVLTVESEWREPALSQLRAPALAAFEQCLRTAVRTRHFGEHSVGCAEELTRLDARAHPALQELRPVRLRVRDEAIVPAG